LNFDFTNYAISGSDRAGMPKVNREHLFAYKTWFPLLPKQVALAKVFDSLASSVSDLETVYRSKLAAIAELKQSLLQKAFAGELTKDFRPELEAALA
jgi:type I restriction enzyme, S subunit